MTATSMIEAARAEFDRHRGPVTCAAGIPGRAALVTSGYDGAVALVDLEAGCFELLGYHEHLVNRITVNEDGSRAASSSSDYEVHLWDLERRERIQVLRGHADDVEDFCFVDDRTGVSVGRDWRVIVWDLETGAIRRVIDGHEKDVLSVVVNDGRIFTTGDDMTLRAWDLESGAELHRWGPFEIETDTCDIDRSRGRAVLGCDDGLIRVFDIESGESLAEIRAHEASIKKVAVSPITGDILSAAYDQKTAVWDATTFAEKVVLERFPATWERSFNWSPDGETILAGSFDGTVLVWDAASGELSREIGANGAGNPCFNDVSAAGADFVTVSDDGYLRTGRLAPGEATWGQTIAPESGRMLANAVTLDPELGMVVTGAHDQKLHIHRCRSTPDGLHVEPGIEVLIGEGPINCVRIARHDGFTGNVFVACYMGSIVRVDESGQVLARLPLHDGAVKALRLHPDRTQGVSCSAEGGLLSWDFDGRILRRFSGHTSIVDDVDIDPTGKLIASVSRDFTVNVYDLEEGKLLQSILLGRRSPKGVCFVDPHTVIVSNYWGALLRVDLETGSVTPWAVAKNGISAVCATADHLLAASYDGGVYLVRKGDLQVEGSLRAMTQRLQPSALI